MIRGLEISDEVADLPRSVIRRQVTNGVAVRMAVLYLLLGTGDLLSQQEGGQGA
jgi:aspartate carbamoyltransferase catalytic subunit